jgi:hypothetical protein
MQSSGIGKPIQSADLSEVVALIHEANNGVKTALTS